MAVSKKLIIQNLIPLVHYFPQFVFNEWHQKFFLLPSGKKLPPKNVGLVSLAQM
jgi:hypothetical protein